MKRAPLSTQNTTSATFQFTRETDLAAGRPLYRVHLVTQDGPPEGNQAPTCVGFVERVPYVTSRGNTGHRWASLVSKHELRDPIHRNRRSAAQALLARISQATRPEEGKTPGNSSTDPFFSAGRLSYDRRGRRFASVILGQAAEKAYARPDFPGDGFTQAYLLALRGLREVLIPRIHPGARVHLVSAPRFLGQPERFPVSSRARRHS